MAHAPRIRSSASARAVRLGLTLSAAFTPALANQSVGAAPGATHTVTNVADGGPGSLRQAILDANASPGGDRIEFDIPSHLCATKCVIRPSIALPPLTGGAIVVAGFSQPGALRPSQRGTGLIQVVLDGSGVENQNGLTLASAGNLVEGLSIHSFGWNGIAIVGPNAHDNRVVGNHIGVDAHGVGAASRRPNGFDGVFIGLKASGNLIGGDLYTERNVISGNTWAGVDVHGPDTAANHIAGNYLGLDAMGGTAVPNSLDGVRVYGGATSTSVGVIADVGERNIIAGNARDGIRMAGDGTRGLVAAGNLIGSTFNGGAPVANGGDGIHIMDGAGDVHVGTEDTASLGMIVGNGGHGVHIENSAGGVVVRRQFIGVDPTGSAAWPNDDGIRIVDSPDVTVGGPGLEGFNIISGNRGVGVRLSGARTTGAVVEGNRIGTNSTGAAAVANGGGGVLIESGASQNVIGNIGNAGNLISGNGGNGIEIDGAGSDDNEIVGNDIGSNALGDAVVSNGGAGVYVHGGAAATRIGSVEARRGNWIVGGSFGIVLQNAGPRTQILANYIGAGEDPSESGLGNDLGGIKIEDATTETQVFGNWIARNGGDGVLAWGVGTMGNRFRTNEIHDNDGMGIRVDNGAHGGIEQPRLVSFDPTSLRLAGESCAGCEVEIYSDAEDEGAQPLMVTEASAMGRFEVTLARPPEHDFLTAIATDPLLGSSGFSPPLPVAAPTATATVTEAPTPTSTATASATATATASVTPGVTRSATATGSASPTATTSRTPAATVTATRAASETPSPTGSPSGNPSRTPEPPPSATQEYAFRIWLPRLSQVQQSP